MLSTNVNNMARRACCWQHPPEHGLQEPQPTSSASSGCLPCISDFPAQSEAGTAGFPGIRQRRKARKRSPGRQIQPAVVAAVVGAQMCQELRFPYLQGPKRDSNKRSPDVKCAGEKQSQVSPQVCKDCRWDLRAFKELYKRKRRFLTVSPVPKGQSQQDAGFGNSLW